MASGGLLGREAESFEDCLDHSDTEIVCPAVCFAVSRQSRTFMPLKELRNGYLNVQTEGS